jgi:O-antigen ligase
VFVGLLGGSTVAAVLLGNGNPAVALAPCLAALLVWMIWARPLRLTLFALLALAWMSEIEGDVFANNLVHTPLRNIGTLLFVKLNNTFAVPALVFSGFDVLLVFLAAAIVYRHATVSRLDNLGRVEVPASLAQAALLSIAAVAWMALYGMVRGGSFRFMLWQVTRHLYLPLIYLLMAEGLRGAVDAVSVGRILLVVGALRSIEAMFLRAMFPSHEVLPHATTHHDSVLFAICFAILLAMVLESPTRRTGKICALLLPVYFGGMIANSRRLVWVELAVVAAFTLVVTPWTRTKRFLARALVLLLLPVVLYALLGWNSASPIFAPLQTVRSIYDPNVDTSTRWRDIENADLVFTFRQDPLLGSGFGRPFAEQEKLPGDLSGTYELEPYIPHNSVLGLWAFGGLLGFAFLWLIYPVGIFFAVRAYRCSRNATERITSLAAAAAIICYLMQGYGDLGFGTWGPVFTVAGALALVGKICVANGAWPSPARRGSAPGVAISREQC